MRVFLAGRQYDFHPICGRSILVGQLTILDTIIFHLPVIAEIGGNPEIIVINDGDDVGRHQGKTFGLFKIPPKIAQIR